MKIEFTIEEVIQYIGNKTDDQFKIKLIEGLVDCLDTVESVDEVYKIIDDVYKLEHNDVS